MALPGRYDNQFAELYKELDTLYATAWRMGFSFLEISTIAEESKWARIYSALIGHNVVKVGKSGRGVSLNDSVKSLIKDRCITFRQWANAYGISYPLLVDVLSTFDGTPIGDEKIHQLLSKDFPFIYTDQTDNNYNSASTQKTKDPLLKSIGNIQVISNQDGSFTSTTLDSAFEGISCEGKNHQMAVYHLVGKIRLINRISRLKSAIQNNNP